MKVMSKRGTSRGIAKPGKIRDLTARGVSKLRWHERMARPEPMRPRIQRGFSDYKARNAICKRLGYGNYSNYLKSPTWASIRQRVMRANDHCCFICGEKATFCHHTNYTVQAMRGTDISGIYPVCNTCHQRSHYDQDGSVSLRVSANDFGVIISGPTLDADSQIPTTRHCCSLKRNGAPCTLMPDRLRDGKWYCHVHDPLGKFQLQQRQSCGIGGRSTPTSAAYTRQEQPLPGSP